MSNFQCPQCGMVNIDCGKEGYKTPKELRYEKALEEIEKICKFNLYQSIVRQSVDSSMSCLNKIRDIISKAKGG